MSLSTIAQTLYNEAAATGQIELNDALFGNGNGFSQLVIDELLRPEGNILLSAKPGDIPQSPSGNSFSFPAALPGNTSDSFLNLAGNTVTVLLSQAMDGTIQLQLTINLTATAAGTTSWIFSDSYPSLLGWPFDFVPFTSPQLILVYGTEAVDLGLVEGVNFNSAFTLSGILAPVAAFLKLFGNQDPKTSYFHGAITQTEDGPAFNISGIIEDIPSMDLQVLTVSSPVLTLSMDYEPLPDDMEIGWGEVVLNTITTFNGNDQDQLITTFLFDYNANDLSLTLSISPEPDSLVTSIDNLGNWMGGQTWNQFFSNPPANILQPFLQSFGIQSYGLRVGLSDLSISSTSLAVGTLKAWDIIPGTLQMDNFSVFWQLINPLGSLSNSNVSLEGDLTLFGKNGEEIYFNGSIQLPDLLLEMALYTETEMSAADWLQTFVSAFGGDTIPQVIHDALANFSMENLSFTMSVPAKSMTFDLSGNISVGDNQVGFKVSLDLVAADVMTYDIEVAFCLNGWEITGEISNNNPDKDVMIVCAWEDDVNPVTLQIIASALGFNDLNIPDALLLDLKSLDLSFNLTKDIFAIAAEATEYGSADLLVCKLPDIGYTFFGGVNINSTISLSNLPVIGKTLSAIDSVEVKNIQALIASQVISEENATNINKVIAAMPDGGDLPQIPEQGMASTINLSMTVDIGGYVIPVSTGLGGSTDGAAPSDQEVVTGAPSGDSNAPVTTTPANQSDGTCWLNLQKAVGPLMFRRIGIKYADPVLWFLLDVSFEGGGLTIDLNGAAVGSPLDSFDPSFAISGIGIDYRTTGFELGGTLMKIAPAANVEWQYAGGVVARLEGLSLSALGSYANIYTNDAHTNTMPSMFLFAQVTGNLGGVPAFFVTGLSAGFGFNSFLRIPGINEVQNFPLVAGLSDPSKIGGKNASPDEALSVLMGLNGGVAWVSNQLGEYWLAAGLRFNSFELVSTNALLVAQFGTHFQFALLGLSKASFPIKSPKTYGYVEMQLEVLVDPTVGFVCLTAVLSANSYVLDPACKLTGGFAFYAWFSPNTHAGDFVITLGGYHPSFDAPSWYPEVPAVGFSWAMDSTISLRGTAYFALTPAAVMAGGELDATYHDGDLKAWFKAWANVLIYWNPFHFDVSIGITVGASYRINLLFTHCTMTASLGATLHIWGPETGGTVRVNWTVISFTISFGAGATGNPGPISWTGFLDQLPDGSNVVRVLPGDGLAANGNSDMSTADAAWQVRPGGFTFNVISSVPNSLLTLNGDSDNPLAKGNLINIRAMQDYRKNGNSNQGKNLQSILNLVVKKDGQPIDTLDSSSTWNITARSENIPKAMWGMGPQDQMPEGTDQLLNDQLTGFVVNSPSTVEGYTPGTIDANTNLTDLVLATGELPINTTTPVGAVPREDAATIEIITAEIATNAIASARNSLFSDLVNLGVNPVTNGDMSTYATDAASIFSGIPMILKPTANA